MKTILLSNIGQRCFFFVALLVINACQDSGNLKALITMANIQNQLTINISPSNYSATGLKTVALTPQIFTVYPSGENPNSSCLTPSLSGTGASVFSIVSETCTGTLLTSTTTCQVEVQGTPTSAENYLASLDVSCGGKTTSATLNLTGKNFEVQSISPTDNSSNIDPNQDIVITFNYGLDTSKIDSNSVKLRESVGHYPIPFSYIYNSGPKQLRLTPLRTTFKQHKIEVKLSTGLESSVGGVALDDVYKIDFTTNNSRIWGHGIASTSATPTIYGGCSKNLTSVTATLNGLAIAMADSDCSDGAWSVSPNLAITDVDYTLIVTGVAGASSTSKTMSVRYCSGMSAIAPDNTYSGLGTDPDPYLINSIEELAGMASNLSATYKITTDLDLACKSWTPIGSLATPFTGKLLGSFKQIKRFTYNAIANDQGLFGYVDTGTLKNIFLSDVFINGGGFLNIGALAGYAKDYSSIEYNYVNGRITNGGQMGGMIGQIFDYTTMSDNQVEVYVHGTNQNNVGGLVGYSTVTAYPVLNYYYRNVTTTNFNFGSGFSYGGMVGYSNASVVRWNRADANLFSSVNGGYVGGMIGNTNSTHYIDDNKVLVSIKGTGSNNNIGGFSARCFGCTRVSGTYVSGDITLAAGTWSGGLIAFTDANSQAYDNLVEMDIAGGARVGGLIGEAWDANSRIKRSLFIGTVSGTADVHKLVGKANAANNTSNNPKLIFNDTTCTGNPGGCGSGLGIGYDTPYLKQKATYESTLHNWFLERGHIWSIDESIDYPRLTGVLCQNRFDNIDPAIDFDIGSGTPGDPYQISSARHLPLMANDLNASYILTADLDLTTKCLRPGVRVGDNVTAFSGTFDGQNHYIYGLNGEASVAYSGFFGKTDGATIQNLTVAGSLLRTSTVSHTGLLIGLADNTTISNVHVSGRIETTVFDAAINYMGLLMGAGNANTHLTSVSAKGSVITYGDYTGLLAGYIGGNVTDAQVKGAPTGRTYTGGIAGYSFGVVSDCSANVYLKHYDNYFYQGGLFAYKNAGSISRCYSTGILTSTSTSAGYVGGLIGALSSASISNSYSEMSVTGYNAVGGLVGWMNVGVPTVTNSYARGAVSLLGGASSGQAVAIKTTGTLTKVYTLDQNADCATPFDGSTNTGGCTDAVGAVEMSAADMQTAASFTGAGVNWDTATIWNIPGATYPTLQ